MRKSSSEFLAKHIDKVTVIYIFVMYAAWIGAWLFERQLERHFPFLASAMQQSIFWITMKLLLWILPS
ncbi:MAG: hypothetical protein WCN92_05455, partial [Eubacteriales bacterium]